MSPLRIRCITIYILQFGYNRGCVFNTAKSTFVACQNASQFVVMCVHNGRLMAVLVAGKVSESTIIAVVAIVAVVIIVIVIVIAVYCYKVKNR